MDDWDEAIGWSEYPARHEENLTIDLGQPPDDSPDSPSFRAVTGSATKLPLP